MTLRHRPQSLLYFRLYPFVVAKSNHYAGYNTRKLYLLSYVIGELLTFQRAVFKCKQSPQDTFEFAKVGWGYGIISTSWPLFPNVFPKISKCWFGLLFVVILSASFSAFIFCCHCSQRCAPLLETFLKRMAADKILLREWRKGHKVYNKDIEI